MKVLLLAYDFPPLISVGGQRPFYWNKYLSELGMEVTVITRHWSETINSPEDYVSPTSTDTLFETGNGSGRIIRVAFKPNLRDKLLLKFGFNKFILIRKTLSFLYTYLEWLFLIFDSKAKIYKVASELLDNERFDLIIATGEPFILFKYANLLSAKYRIPWIADYRDGWTSNQGDYSFNFLEKMRHSFFRKKELEILHSVLFITTAAPPYKTELQLLFPTKKIDVIYNGFDENVISRIANIQSRNDKFIVSYAGMLYKHQKLETFLDAIDQLINEKAIAKREIELIFYGMNSYPESKERLFNYRPGLKDIIVTTNRLPYADLMEKLKESHLLLLLSKKNANWLNTKLFDYFAVKRCVLLIEGDEGILDLLLNETNSGYSASSITKAKEIILQQFGNFKNGANSEITLLPKYLDYSRKKQAEHFYNLIKNFM